MPAQLTRMSNHLAETMRSECAQLSAADSLNPRVLRGIVGTAGLRLAGSALTFVTSIILARLMGVREYGLLAYILAWVGLLGVVGVFGLDRLLVREVAIYRMSAAWGLLRGLLCWAHLTALLISSVLVVLVICLYPRHTTQVGAQMVSSLPAASCLLICVVIMRLSGSALQGFHRVISSQFAESFIQPASVLILIVTVSVIWHGRLLAAQVLTLYVIAAGAACIFMGWQLWRILPPGVRGASVSVQYASRGWLVAALPLFLVGILDVLNNQISSLMLGTLAGTTALGMYAAAERGAQLVTFPLAAVNLTLAPTFANLYQAGELAGLQRLVTKSARLVLMASAPIALGLMLGGHWFLLLFGREFTDGRLPLMILCIGQLMNAAMGSVGFLLIMTGHGREAAIGIGIGVSVNLLLSTLFIQLWGASGAALATASSLIIWNVVLALFVWKRLGIMTTALGRIGGR